MSVDAGRELDALIAETVLGLNVVARDWPCGRDPDCGQYHPAGSLQEGLLEETATYTARDVVYAIGRTALGWSVRLVPYYSTDLAAAWEVFTHPAMVGQLLGWNVYDARARPDLPEVDDLGYAREYMCTARGVPIPAPTAPLAICWAALQTRGIDTGGGA
jgi:hypothetical protein